MCGIVGYVGPRDAAAVVVEGLARLEYRGYDSAGLAVVDGGELRVRRSVGKLASLRRRLADTPVGGSCGLGHTRWATHGAVTEENAHPHRDASGDIVVVQNGIVENYLELKGRLIERGHSFRSQTDTEVIALLIGDYYAEAGSLERAVRLTLADLRGGNAVVALCRHDPGTLVAARLGHAGGVVVGLGEGESFVASDIPAISAHTRRMLFLDNGELAVVTAEGARVSRLDGAAVAKRPTTISWDAEAAGKGAFPHYMLKEIHEQPRALTDILRGRVDLEGGRVLLDELRLDDGELWRLGRIYSVSCGTGWHAALVGKYMLETLARVRVDVDYGSEFRYRQPLLGHDTMLLAISQSGETADTLAAMEEARAQGTRSLALVNAVGSQAARLADAGALYLHAGPEVAVASTKAFTAMLAAQYLLALRLAEARGTLSPHHIREHIAALLRLPEQVGRILERAGECERLAGELDGASSALFLGRQACYPIALEGALKLKEISYIHAEGYPAGEMKHGPIALIDGRLPVVCLAPRDATYEKMRSNIAQVRARGGRVLAVVTEGDEELAAEADWSLAVPATLPLLTPVLASVPLQLLAYYVAVRRGADVDQPRNLAKSVTVE